MDLRYSESDEKFRTELRAWLEDAVPVHGEPPAGNDWHERREYDTAWQRKLYDAGYAGINWPKQYGGRDASLTEQLVYYEEIARSGAPYIGVNFVGMLHGGPTLMTEGTAEQKARHLPYILKGEQVWCQGFSEPGAGSDLASLSTRAETTTWSPAPRSGAASLSWPTTVSYWCARTRSCPSTRGSAG